MQNDANPPRTPATTTSITMMPMFIAIAMGESLLPKHTGHANAARGAADIAITRSVLRMTSIALQPSRFPLEGGAVHRQPDAARERRDAGQRVRHGMRRLILPHRPGRDERGQNDRRTDEEQVECSQRHQCLGGSACDALTAPFGVPIESMSVNIGTVIRMMKPMTVSTSAP